jgi:hypothetical protein
MGVFFRPAISRRAKPFFLIKFSPVFVPFLVLKSCKKWGKNRAFFQGQIFCCKEFTIFFRSILMGFGLLVRVVGGCFLSALVDGLIHQNWR